MRRTCCCLLDDGNILLHYNLDENICKTQNLINRPTCPFLRRLCCNLPFPMGHSSLRLLQAIFIAKTSKYRVQRGGRTVALPWPPGSKSEPSCSQGSQGTSPPELLLFMPDLTPSQSSFVLLGVGADLTHSGVQDPVSGPLHHRVLHATWSLLSSGTRTRCCRLPQCFPWDMYRQALSSPRETGCCPAAQRGRPMGWLCCLWQLFLFWILLSPLQQLPTD